MTEYEERLSKLVIVEDIKFIYRGGIYQAVKPEDFYACRDCALNKNCSGNNVIPECQEFIFVSVPKEDIK